MREISPSWTRENNYFLKPVRISGAQHRAPCSPCCHSPGTTKKCSSHSPLLLHSAWEIIHKVYQIISTYQHIWSYRDYYFQLTGIISPLNRADTFNTSSLLQEARSPCFHSSSRQLPFQLTSDHSLALCLVSLNYLLVIPWCALCCPHPLLFTWNNLPHPSSLGSFLKPNILGHFSSWPCSEKSLPHRSRPSSSVWL